MSAHASKLFKKYDYDLTSNTGIDLLGTYAIELTPNLVSKDATNLARRCSLNWV
jgi:hypothetical protein